MNKANNKIAITVENHELLAKAQDLARRLSLPLITQSDVTGLYQFFLAVTPERLELRENSAKNTKPIVVDFLAPTITYRIKYGGGKNQLIAKALGIKNKKHPLVIDATAGFGIDAFLLASLGCEVLMLERSPIIHALLADGLEHLNKSSISTHLKLKLKLTESFAYLNQIRENRKSKVDVIYLDPMYPKRSKSALNKKAMRILHELVDDNSDASQLLELALKCVKNRVVIKRPRLASNLGELQPDVQFFSPGTRYDVYLPSQEEL